MSILEAIYESMAPRLRFEDMINLELQDNNPSTSPYVGFFCISNRGGAMSILALLNDRSQMIWAEGNYADSLNAYLTGELINRNISYCLGFFCIIDPDEF